MKTVGPHKPDARRIADAADAGAPAAVTKATATEATRKVGAPLPDLPSGAAGAAARRDASPGALPPSGATQLAGKSLDEAATTLAELARTTTYPHLAEVFGRAATAAADVARMAKVATPLRLTLKDDKSRPPVIEAFLDRGVSGPADAPRPKLQLSPTDRSIKPFPVDPALVEGLRGGARVELVLDKNAPDKQTYLIKADDSAYAGTFAAQVVLEGGVPYAVGLPSAPVYARVPLPGGEALVGKTVLVDVDHASDPSLRSGRVREVVGEAGGLSAKLLDAAIREGVAVGHSAAAMAEVDALLANPPIEGKSFEHLPFITIDNVGSKDLDQAMCIQKRADGGFDVHYAIADVAHFIKPNSALDREARRRTQTMYLADGHNIPMLPRELSEGLISLLPDQRRRAFIVTVSLDANGEVTGRKFERGVMKSQQQLAYSQVQAYMDAAGPDGKVKAGSKADDLSGQPWSQNLELLRELGQKRVAKSVARGVVPSDHAFTTLGVRDGGLVTRREDRNQVEKWNEQISLLANEAVGAELRTRNVKALFRTHPAPTPEKVEAFRELVGALGVPWAQEQSLAAYVRGLDPGAPLTSIIAGSSSMVNQPATYETTYSGGHSGLALEDYVHFTAPMRRYTDVVVARVLAALVEGGKVPYQKPNDRTLDQVQRLTEDVRRREGNLSAREGTVLTAAWFADKLGHTLDGRIVGVRPSGVKVELAGSGLVVTVPVAALGGASGAATGILEASGSKLAVGERRFGYGQAIQLSAEGVDAGTGRVVFDVK